MNLAHLHLVLNHMPVVGIPLALVFLIHGSINKNNNSQKFSLWVLTVISVLILPVYFTGEPAEHAVEHLPGIFESLIKSHEEAAEVSLVLVLLTGISSCLALYFYNQEKKLKNLIKGTILLAIVASGSLAYTANLGGKIRHVEARSDSISMTGY